MSALLGRIRAGLPRWRRVAMTAGAIFAVIVFLWIPALFWLAVVIGLVAWLFVVHDQRDEASAETVELLFQAAAANARAHRAESDRDAVVARLAEVVAEKVEHGHICPLTGAAMANYTGASTIEVSR